MKITRQHHEVRLLRMLIREALQNLIEEEATKPTSSTTPTDKTSNPPGEDKGQMRKQALKKVRSNLTGPAKNAMKLAAKGPGSPADKVSDTASEFAKEMLQLQVDSGKKIDASMLKKGIFNVGVNLSKTVADTQKSQEEIDKMLTKKPA